LDSQRPLCHSRESGNPGSIFCYSVLDAESKVYYLLLVLKKKKKPGSPIKLGMTFYFYHSALPILSFPRKRESTVTVIPSLTGNPFFSPSFCNSALDAESLFVIPAKAGIHSNCHSSLTGNPGIIYSF